MLEVPAGAEGPHPDLGALLTALAQRGVNARQRERTTPAAEGVCETVEHLDGQETTAVKHLDVRSFAGEPAH